MRLYRLRGQSADAHAHVWGGKRLTEVWQSRRQLLALNLHGPPGLTDTVFVWVGDRGVKKVLVNGKDVAFCVDSNQRLAHGPVTFTSKPLKVEIFCGDRSADQIPEAPAPPDVLGWRNAH